MFNNDDNYESFASLSQRIFNITSIIYLLKMIMKGYITIMLIVSQKSRTGDATVR